MDRFSVIPAVFVIVRDKNGKVLLHKRARTGFMDGYYDVPSGHVEADETLRAAAVRELKEEVDLDVDIKDLVLVHVGQNNQNKPYVNFLFEAKKWRGTPKICEPHKNDDLQFFALSKLPKTVPHVAEVLKDLTNKKISFAYFEPGYAKRNDA